MGCGTNTVPGFAEFDKQFPLRKTYFLDEVELEDPETEYERFMKIGVK
jgi:hypothetical protein